MVNCPFVLGQLVNVSPKFKYAADWQGEYIVVSIDWEYQKGDGQGVNIGIASRGDIADRYGRTDGFDVEDLLPAN